MKTVNGITPGEKDVSAEVKANKGDEVVAPFRKRYTLEELIAQCDPKARRPKDKAWLNALPVGKELL